MNIIIGLVVVVVTVLTVLSLCSSAKNGDEILRDVSKDLGKNKK